MSKTKSFLVTIVGLSLALLLYMNNTTFRLQNCRYGSVPLLRNVETEEPFLRVDDIGILKGLGAEFLPNFKNPCWYEARRGNRKPFEMSEVVLSHGVRSSVQERQKNVSQPMVLRCLPYFFLIGQPKCATTDIFHRISCHPDVAEPLLKGPHWWSRKRFGWPYAAQPTPFSEYINVFNASKIQEERRPNELQGTWEYPRITGDGSTSTLWDSSQAMNYLHHLMITNKHGDITTKLLSGRKNPITFPEGKNLSKIHFTTYKQTNSSGTNESSALQNGVVLPFTVADTIHLVLPKSRIIAVFREPVSRLYSSYLFFTKKADLSPLHFDYCVRSSIRKWNACIQQHSDRTCAYNKTLQKSMDVRLYNGLYSIYIKDWLQVFPQEQVLVLRMEDYQKNISRTLEDIYCHLGLRTPMPAESKRMNINRVYNKNMRKFSVGKMLHSTRKILQDFYKPYNRDLANTFNNAKLDWMDIYENQ